MSIFTDVKHGFLTQQFSANFRAFIIEPQDVCVILNGNIWSQTTLTQLACCEYSDFNLSNTTFEEDNYDGLVILQECHLIGSPDCCSAQFPSLVVESQKGPLLDLVSNLKTTSKVVSLGSKCIAEESSTSLIQTNGPPLPKTRKIGVISSMTAPPCATPRKRKSHHLLLLLQPIPVHPTQIMIETNLTNSWKMHYYDSRKVTTNDVFPEESGDLILNSRLLLLSLLLPKRELDKTTQQSQADDLPEKSTRKLALCNPPPRKESEKKTQPIHEDYPCSQTTVLPPKELHM